MKPLMFGSFLFVLVVMLGCISAPSQPTQPTGNETQNETPVEHSVALNPSDFVSGITNRYFNLTFGKNFVYENQIEEGIERIEVYVTNETKTVMGIPVTVVWDRVWLNDELIEDTKDWYAQDKDGNVWYMGEDTVELAGGLIVSHAGAWEAGVAGGQAGIIMKANPQVGDSYQQEYLKGVAEDRADVVALNEAVSVSYGNFTGCLKTREYTPLEPGVEAFKYYCPQVGFVVLELEEGERVELVNVTMKTNVTVETPTDELQANITEDEARAIALAEVPGEVTDIVIERKFGKTTYVVEIVAASDGIETDVIIDIETGEVLAVEK
jgi:uncharacterized membrane protein YkoI